jgi:hypothetical protein
MPIAPQHLAARCALPHPRQHLVFFTTQRHFLLPVFPPSRSAGGSPRDFRRGNKYLIGEFTVKLKEAAIGIAESGGEFRSAVSVWVGSSGIRVATALET